MKTIWWCERCHASGIVTYAPSVGAWEVTETIAAHHAVTQIAKLSRCTSSSEKLRVQHVNGNRHAPLPAPPPQEVP